MSQENIDRFREIVLREPGLLAAFRNRSVGSFVDFAVALGQERGCEFTADEVEKELRRWRRLWIERSL